MPQYLETLKQCYFLSHRSNPYCVYGVAKRYCPFKTPTLYTVAQMNVCYCGLDFYSRFH